MFFMTEYALFFYDLYIYMQNLKKYLMVLLLVGPFLSGCASFTKNPGPNPGLLQVGQAGPFCSFCTAILCGPAVSRGRNEGYLKTSSEIEDLIPIYDIKANIHHASLAYNGLDERTYEEASLHAFTMNNYPHVRESIDAAEQNGIVDSNQANRMRRHLCHCNFINTDLILWAFKHGGITAPEARILLFRWLKATEHYDTLNFYLHRGNRYMLSKLEGANLISCEEAKYFARFWAGRHVRLEGSQYEDLAMYGDLAHEDLLALQENELIFIIQMLDAVTESHNRTNRCIEGSGKCARQIQKRFRQVQKILRSDLHMPTSLEGLL